MASMGSSREEILAYATAKGLPCDEEYLTRLMRKAEGAAAGPQSRDVFNTDVSA